MLCIGIDSGTQSTKSIVVDVASGEVVASAQQTYGLIQGLPPDHMEQDPKAWSDAFASRRPKGRHFMAPGSMAW